MFKPSTVRMRTPADQKPSVDTKTYSQEKIAAVTKQASKPMTGRTVKINGKTLPVNCFCAKQRAGESECYFFNIGRYCSVRFSAASFVCVGKKTSRGRLCLLRRVYARIVPVERNICRRQVINSFMYVPYERYWTYDGKSFPISRLHGQVQYKSTDT